MLKYTLKRLISFVPMIIAISLIAFLVSTCAPGDPVESLSKAAGNEGGADQQSGTLKKDKQKLRKKLGLDLPLFYLSISNLASCDTLYKVQDRDQRENLERLIHKYGNWSAIDNYYNSLLNLQREQQSIDIELVFALDTNLDRNKVNEELNQIGFNIVGLLEENRDNLVEDKYKNLDQLIIIDTYFPSLKDPYENLKNNFILLEESKTRWKTFIPWINWYGVNSQYHWWVFGDLFHSKKTERKGIIRGDFGVSYKDSQPIKDKIWNKVGISFTLSLLSILIAYLISLPLGIYSAINKDSNSDKGISWKSLLS